MRLVSNPSFFVLLLLLPLRAQDATVDHANFDAILRASVRDGMVDYLGIRRDHFAALRRYIDAMAQVDPAKLEKDTRLAYYINVYNATMIATVVDRLVVGYSTAANDYRVFKEPTVRLRTGKVSLDHLEHEIIRKQFAEPRIHVALVCGARSCPPLRDRAYTGEDLRKVLEGNMRAFVRDDGRNVIDRKDKRARLSQIFDWFKADFGGEDGVRDYVSRHAGVDMSGFAVEFLPYSWELNIAPPRGRWASLKRATGDLPRGAYVEVLGERGKRFEVRAAGGATHLVEAEALAAVGTGKEK